MQLRSVLYGSALYHLSLWGRSPGVLTTSPDEPWPGSAPQGEAMLAGDFRFGGEAIHGTTPPWTATASVAWSAALHRFTWLADVAACGGDAAWRTVQLWISDWLDRCDAWDAIAWRADVIGDRLVAWIEHVDDIVGRANDPGFRERLFDSMARQMRHLARVASREAPGLPRLAALRGLVVAAAALGDRRRLDDALTRLVRECEAQILPDGGHAARSPVTQLFAMRYLIDARAAVRAAEVEVPAGLQSAIDRAAPLLRFFRHGDGKLALFNGANEGDVAAIDLVLARADAKGRPPFSAPHVGFQRLQAGRTLVLVDTGRPPAPGFDSEAHAGTLSFEMSHARERLIVNCGAHRGPDPVWRTVARSTAAHSTLILADTNSSEIRPDGSLGRGPTHVPCERAEDGGSQWIAADHDGYQPLFGIIHARQLFLAADGEDLRGEDRVSGRAGLGFTIRFHLHPHVQASLTQEGNAVLLRLASGIGWRLRAQGAVMSLAESIYLGGDEPRKSQQVVLDGHVGTTGATVKWALRRETKKPSHSDDAAN
ncbi:MAG TPA: heparinase II/III family protein [Stellaceae bacterium]|nr:heparinase II/III family protein [Stellaceae bacterium]